MFTPFDIRDGKAVVTADTSHLDAYGSSDKTICPLITYAGSCAVTSSGVSAKPRDTHSSSTPAYSSSTPAYSYSWPNCTQARNYWIIDWP
ncbi:MAG: hypothetical protein U0J70_06975 [Atopobiaceae bacterium]|nr:hypothetical protein [Atopobiaceae bacterium]